MGNRIRAIRTEQGLSQKDLCEKAGISQSALSAIERSEKSPTAETLRGIAAALGVLVSDLLEEKYCPVCGFEYAYDEGMDSLDHRKTHERAQAIIDRFGFYWPYRVRKIETTSARAILSNPKATDAAHYEAAIRLYKALFSRSAFAYEYGDHPDFRAYVAMLLNSPENARIIPPATRARLEAEFGKREGIAAGAYYRNENPDKARISALCEKIKTMSPKYLDVIEAICNLPL